MRRRSRAITTARAAAEEGERAAPIPEEVKAVTEAEGTAEQATMNAERSRS